MTARRAQRPVVRIRDVAQDAGVSPQTVSNVLNDQGRFTEETRARVLASVERTGYRPNRAARQLRTRRSRLIGLHLPAAQLSVSNTFSIAFVREVIEAVRRVDHQLVVLTTPVDSPDLDAELLAPGVDGYVLFNVGLDDPRPRVLVDAGVPYALFGRALDPDIQGWIDIDNAAAMTPLVDHLVERGYRTFGYVTYDDDAYWTQERWEGATARLAHHGLAIDPRWLLRGTEAEIRENVAPVLLGPDRPEAIICESDALAEIVHVMATRQGLLPGRDVAITGFDAVPMRFELEPSLTSVAIPVREVADAVVRQVLDEVDGAAAPTAGTFLPTRLAVGGST
ncbi:LacI family transcriptional regulator [Actinotalea sp. M2MS4P-6]|uniref:LacI family DNA-binding transcriptional regulator n=1 Tax=Actinotalea sp. M2MS4P-6 TaxID=2983762 RepID=UPI0021E3D113|nr:LacI family DNA-binding transcriptional regulator [Actinotalea sp. M2MS4P-6]MCV2395680.1 LacI family transcriptional regulator [Actinotalea sp. M2MS4P-6]